MNLKEPEEFEVSENRLRGRISNHKAIIPPPALKYSGGFFSAPLLPYNKFSHVIL